jgi:hypothetical protein
MGSGMLIIPVSERWREYAREHAEEFGTTINGDGDDAFIGLLGEMAFQRACNEHNVPATWVGREKLPWDFTFPAGETLDVKTVQNSWGKPPSGNMHGLVPNYQVDYPLDTYVFAALNWPEGEEPDKVYLMGWMDKAPFMEHEHMQRYKEGDKMGGQTASVDCHGLKLKYLQPIENLLWLESGG